MSKLQPIYIPMMTIPRYADSIGVTKDVVNGWIKRGYIPTTKIGKRRLINITAINQILQEEY